MRLPDTLTPNPLRRKLMEMTNKRPELGNAELLRQVFDANSWRVACVAKALGISRQGIYDAARRLDIEIPALTAAQRSANAQHALSVRWSKRRKGQAA